MSESGELWKMKKQRKRVDELKMRFIGEK